MEKIKEYLIGKLPNSQFTVYDDYTVLQLIWKLIVPSINHLIDDTKTLTTNILNKVSFDDMLSKYNFIRNVDKYDYQGTWWGIDKPTKIEGGIDGVVEQIKFKDIPELVERINYVETDLRLFGAIGDGNIHLASEKYSSLNELKEDYPTAQSLNDTIDQLAIEKALLYCRDNGIKLIAKNGEYIINRSLWVRTGCSLSFEEKAIIKGSSNESSLIYFDGTKNAKWENGKVIRIGSPFTKYSNTCEIRNDSDDTLIFENMEFINNISPSSASVGNSGIQIHYKASPILIKCIGRGCKTNNSFTRYSIGIRIGGIGNSSASPHLMNCIGYGGYGYGSYGIELDNTKEGGNFLLENCIAYGGYGEECCGFSLDDISNGVLNNCIGYGGENGGDGLVCWASTTVTLNNCVFNGVKGNGVSVVSGKPIFNNCVGVPSALSNNSKGFSLGWFSNAVLNHCSILAPRNSTKYMYKSNENFINMPVGCDSFISNLSIQSLKRNTGVTLKIGTSQGGNEIADNISLDVAAEQWCNISFTTKVKDIIKSGGRLYFTPSSTITDESFVVTLSYVMGTTQQRMLVISSNIGVTCNGVIIDGYQFENSVACEFTEMTPNIRFNNCDIKMNETSTSNGIALKSKNTRNNQDVYNCVIKGDIVNFNFAPPINKEMKTNKLISETNRGIDFELDSNNAITFSSISRAILAYKGNDEIGVGTSSYYFKEGYFKNGVVVKSPNGTVYRLSVNDSGQVIATR